MHEPASLRCTVPISLYVVRECYASLCVTCTSLLNAQLEESGHWKKQNHNPVPEVLVPAPSCKFGCWVMVFFLCTVHGQKFLL